MQNITVGIPRGLLYYRYRDVWINFFSKLGINVIISPETTQGITDKGISIAGSEACLALKIFFGHVDSLVGKCDYVLVPRVRSYGKFREMCPRFDALYDLTTNTFWDSGQNFLTFNVDVKCGAMEEQGFVELGQELGATARVAKAAYRSAIRSAKRTEKSACMCEADKLSIANKESKLKVLLVGRNYVIEDSYIGKPIADFLCQNGAVPIRAYQVAPETALCRSVDITPTCKWEFCREAVGGLEMYRDSADGVILVSTFPCGPDSMVNEILLRRISDRPVLTLVLDGQSGTAGLETRLESFLDIIRFKKGLL